MICVVVYVFMTRKNGKNTVERGFYGFFSFFERLLAKNTYPELVQVLAIVYHEAVSLWTLFIPRPEVEKMI